MIRNIIIIIFLGLINLQSNEILNDKLVYNQGDNISISKCKKSQWCKIENSIYLVKQFRLSKDIKKVKASGKTYLYIKKTRDKELKIYLQNRVQNSTDIGLQIDFKYGFIRAVLVADYYIERKKRLKTKVKEIPKIKESVKTKTKVKVVIIKEKYNPTVLVKKIEIAKIEQKPKSKKATRKDKIKIYNTKTNSINNMFQSIGILVEGYEVSRFSNDNIPQNITSSGVDYKIGFKYDSYRYYVNAKVSSGLLLLLSADYIYTSNIFAGVSTGYAQININDTSSSLSGGLLGFQIGYIINSNFDLTYQYISSSLEEKVSNVQYSIDNINYITLNYKF